MERSGRVPVPVPLPSTIERSGRTLSRPSSSYPAVSYFPELDCLRQRLDARTLLDAERRAGALSVGADEVLICAGAITAEHYARELALWLNLGFDSLRNIPRDWYPFDEARLIEALASGVLPLRAHGREVFVVAPSGLRARQAVAYFHDRPERSSNVWITSPDCLQQFVTRHAAATLASHAADALRVQQPRLSTGPRRSWRSLAAIASGCRRCCGSGGGLRPRRPTASSDDRHLSRLGSAALGLIGLRRRGLLFTALVLLLMPVHWLLLSAAAWRALLQFCINPYSWEKTEHGRAPTSRWRMRREQAKRQIKIQGIASSHITDTV